MLQELSTIEETMVDIYIKLINFKLSTQFLQVIP